MDLLLWMALWLMGGWFTLGYVLGMDRDRRAMNWRSELALALLMCGFCLLWPMFWAAMLYVRGTRNG